MVEQTASDSVFGVIFRNRAAYVLWGFSFVALLFVTLMTWLAVYGELDDPESPVLGMGVLILFWFGTIGLLTFAASRPVTAVAITVGGGVHINHRYPFRKESRHVAVADIVEVSVEDGFDGRPVLLHQNDAQRRFVCRSHGKPRPATLRRCPNTVQFVPRLTVVGAICQLRSGHADIWSATR